MIRQRHPIRRYTPLRPGKPPRRKSWIKRKAARRWKRQIQEPEYKGWIARQPCVCAALDPRGCKGRIEVHHAGKRGLGQRATDATCLPMCTAHHREPGFWLLLPWASWTWYVRRAWLDMLIAQHRARWLILKAEAEAEI